MSTDATLLPNDVSLLKGIIAQQHEAMVNQQRQIGQLEYRLDQLLRRLYGPRAERIDPDQMSLFDLEPEGPATPEQPVEEEPETTSNTKKKPKGHGRRSFPENIERREILLDIPDSEKTCPCCGKDRQEIGRMVSERLGYDPASFYVNQYVQLKYACECERSGVVTAEKPIAVIERGNAEPDLLAFTAVSRFDDHSPYHRQENGQFKRAGIDIPRSTQCDWMRQIGELLTPLYDLMHERVLRSDVLGTDDTPVQMQEKGRGKTRKSYLWGYRGDEACHPQRYANMRFSSSRLANEARIRMLDNPLATRQFQYLLFVDRRRGREVVAVQLLLHRKRRLADARRKRIGRPRRYFQLRQTQKIFFVRLVRLGCFPGQLLALGQDRGKA